MNMASATTRILSGVLVLLFVQIIAVYFLQHNFYRGVCFLVTVLVVLRFLGYYFSVPIDFRQYELFDPRIYATNSIMRSLGDLLINSVFFLWVVLFARHYMQVKEIAFTTQNKILKWVIVLTGVAVLLVSTFVVGNLIRSMVSDSQISFDVVNFFTLNIYSVIVFLVLGSLAIGFFLLSQIVIYLLQPLFPNRIMALIFLITNILQAF